MDIDNRFEIKLANLMSDYIKYDDKGRPQQESVREILYKMANVVTVMLTPIANDVSEQAARDELTEFQKALEKWFSLHRGFMQLRSCEE